MSDWDLTSGNSDYTSKTNVNQKIKLSLVTAPTISIVSTDEAKNYLKIDDYTDDDNLISDLITASTGMIEQELGGVAICTQTWKQYQKGGIETIDLMVEPVTGVPTVSYNSSFSTTTATNITYSSHFRCVESELYHVDGWFKEGRDGDGYTITFEAGMYNADNYNSSDDLRLDMLKTAILRTVAYLYENRESMMTEIKENELSVKYDNKDLPMEIKRLIMPLHTGKGLI